VHIRDRLKVVEGHIRDRLKVVEVHIRDRLKVVDISLYVPDSFCMRTRRMKVLGAVAVYHCS